MKIRVALFAVTLVLLSFNLACTRPETPAVLTPSTGLPPSPTALPLHLVLPTAAATPFPTPAQPSTFAPLPTVSGDSARQELIGRLESVLDQEVSSGSFSGTVLIAYQGDILVDRGYGMANREDGSLNTPQTEFRIASLTKQFTAVAIMMLQEQGRLNVQDPICKYFTDCPEAWKDITLHHLLTHTSGIPDILMMLDADELAQSWTRDGLIDYFKDLALNFPPGQGMWYSNSGYDLLGCVIEKVSGEPYTQFLQENIFTPLHMESTGYDDRSSVHSPFAAGYTPDGFGGAFLADYVDGSVLYAAGGLYSTVEDLYRWEQALYAGRVIAPETMATMMTPYNPPSNGGGETGYGYGWFVDKILKRRVVLHNGNVSGYAGTMMHWPDDDLTIIILSNLEYAPVADMGYRLAQAVLEPK